MTVGMVDKSSPVPLYYQLLLVIRAAIESGELKPGDCLPTESELMESSAVSRATVRQAVLELVREGYVYRVKSRGTFVLPPAETTRILGSLGGFSEEMAERGVPQRSTVLDRRTTVPDVRIAGMLRIAPGQTIFSVRRLRSVRGVPLVIVENHIPTSRCPGIEHMDLESVSLYKLLETRFGLRAHHGRREFEPVLPADSEEAKLLAIDLETPLLRVESVVYAENGTPIEHFEARIRGKFIVDLIRSSAESPRVATWPIVVPVAGSADGEGERP